MQNLVLGDVSACDHPPDLGVVVGVRGLVLFDFGGTLDADGSRWSVRFHAAYRSVGGKQSFAAFDRAFRESDRALERLSGIERLGFRAMVDAQTALLLPRLSDGAELPARAIADQFHSSTCAMVRRNDEVSIRDIEHLADDDPDQLALPVRRALIMESSQDAANGTRVVFLHKASVETGGGEI